MKNQLIVKRENSPVPELLRHVFGLLSVLLLCSISAAQEERYGYNVIETYPHEITSFTQGLVYHEGYLFEGSGKNGLSMLRKVNLEDGEVLMSKRLSDRYFGEGVEIVGDKIYQLTWQSHMVFVYDKSNFEQIGTHYNPTQGWGLAYDDEHLILSDGTDTLQFLDPESFTAVRKVQVKFNDQPINNLNELEYIDGEVWANIWQTDYIIRIDPASGVVRSIVDLSGLSERTRLGSSEAVLNGIAWDSENRRLFVTGKHWSNLFEIELVQN
ncbi:MAG: glutaminyl-peptide cyclotransferase [Gammaproteobacteria bacterium]|nr:glutaminyl-peptide cyclotransferase [Gammaproteobacteria bacterium]